MKLSYKSQTLTLPQQLAFVPLKDTVVFPGAVVPIFFASPDILTLFDKLVTEEGLIGCVPQRDSSVKDPQPSDVLSMGTVCKLLQVVRLPERGSKIVVEGISRVLLHDIIREAGHFRAAVKQIHEPSEKAALSDLLVQSVALLFRVSLSLGRPLSDDILRGVERADHPGRLADLVATALHLGFKEQQDIFETVDPLERLGKVFSRLTREIQSFLPKSPTFYSPVREAGKLNKEHLSRQPFKAVKDLSEDDPYQAEIQELREKVRTAGMPEKVEEIALKEISRLERINPSSAEYTVSRTYLDYLVNLPWNKKTEDNLDLNRARSILNEDHFDLEKVKDRILEFLAVRKLKNPMKGPILCFVGPPGVGKTSLGRSIARALGRKFIRISLGGVRDEAEIRGHRRTYVGALPGRIIQEIRRANTSNPVFMLDEVDKIGQDIRGDPASALLEALDPEQNFSFTDHYLDVPFDLSNVLFIATANTLSPIHPALLDRMEVIHLPGYTEEEKEKIAFQFLIPRQKEENGIKDFPVSFTTGAVLKIISEYTREAGVRTLEKQIAAICRKLARAITMGDSVKDVIDEEAVEKFLGPRKFYREAAQEKDRVGVATGIAWTENGGEIIFIETSKMKGEKGLILTGSLGDVMKESAQAALSYIRANANTLMVPEDFYGEYDIHIHIPAGATPKDGPSAGVAIAAAIVSLLKARPIPGDLAMTGELTLSGRILPVGGVKEKILAARRAGVKTVILPKKNEQELSEIPKEVTNDLSLVFVDHIQEVLEIARLR